MKAPLSDGERARVVERASAAGLSVPRYLVEAGLAGDRRTASQRRGLVMELLLVRRLAAAIGNNLNQLARTANATGRVPDELPVVVAAVGRVLGTNPVGLMLYLFGPGRSNEHTGQRVIAASMTLGIEDGTRLDHRTQREEIKELGGQLDSYRMALGVELRNGHLWHCAISLPPGDSTRERRLSDEQWATVVRAAVDRLGFDTEGKAPCRWIAIHHGRSVEGNEHVHLVASIVREDGTTASYFRDWVTLSKLCRDMEQRFGLQIVEGRNGVGGPDVSRAQLERAKREGKGEQGWRAPSGQSSR